MKRFFQPVEKDGSAKKPTLPQSDKDKDNDNGETSVDGTKKEPLKFLTWNANSFLLRVKNDWPEFTNFVTSFDPDVIAIQVRVFLFSPTHSLSLILRLVLIMGFGRHY